MDQAQIHKDAGNEFFRQNKLLEAIKEYTMAIHLYPRHAKYYRHRSEAKLKLHDYEGAYEDANKAIEVDHSHIEGHYNKTIALWSLKSYQTATEKLQRLHEDDPNDETIKNQMRECKNLELQRGNTFYLLISLRNIQL